MSNTLFDFNLPFAPFAPFAPVSLLTPPAQRWLDVLTGTPQSISEAMASAMGLRGPLYRQLLAGQPDPFKAMACHDDAPAWPLDWSDTCSRASAVMSKAVAKASQRQMELCQSWLEAQQQFAPIADAKGLHDRIEWLHGQTTQTMTQLRSMVDEYLDAWFAAAGIIADAWPTATPGEPAGRDEPVNHAAAKQADGGKAASAASRTATKRR